MYNVTFTATSLVGLCTYTAALSLSVTIFNCSLTAAFTQTVTNGIVNFKSTNTGTSLSTTHVWAFNDGNPLKNGTSPTHTYSTPGTYSVQLFVADNTFFFCQNSVSNAVVITNTVC